jgi:hypothetical protein
MGPWLVEVNDRSGLEDWLAGGPDKNGPSVAMLVRGDGDGVRGLLPNALDAAKLDPRRVVVWVRNEDLFTEDETAQLFGGGEETVATVLSAPRTAGGWMTRDRIGVDDAAFAFTQAEEARG